jgi:uncharacterized membrane protein/predicted DsbA family dithiol-disulfide isomerase
VNRAFWPTLLRLALLFALGASAALTIDYLSTNPAFCGVSSGCGVVRRSGFGYLGRVPLPALGLIAFVGVLSLSLGPVSIRRFSTWAAMLGALLGGVLIVIQALVVKAFCWLCLVTDMSAIVAGAAGVALVVRKLEGEPSGSAVPNGPLRSWAWGALGALAVAAPLLWPLVRPAGDLPSGVRERYVAGKINVVEFVDFQCPFCRMFHPTLRKVVGEFGDRVHFVRLDLPLESHVHARGAAKAHLCADEQREGDRMAEALFESEDLTEKGLRATATALGLDVARLEKCLAAAKTEKKLKEVESILRDSGMLQGLPTTFVGAAMIVGAQDDVALRDAFEQAAAGGGEGGVPAWVYLAGVLLVGLAITWLGRQKTDGSEESPVNSNS